MVCAILKMETVKVSRAMGEEAALLAGANLQGAFLWNDNLNRQWTQVKAGVTAR